MQMCHIGHVFIILSVIIIIIKSLQKKKEASNPETLWHSLFLSQKYNLYSKTLYLIRKIKAVILNVWTKRILHYKMTGWIVCITPHLLISKRTWMSYIDMQSRMADRASDAAQHAEGCNLFPVLTDGLYCMCPVFSCPWTRSTPEHAFLIHWEMSSRLSEHHVIMISLRGKRKDNV